MRKNARDTRQKKLIIACLAGYSDALFTADELTENLRNSGTPVGRATVYRFLGRLESEGLVKKHTTPGGASARYQYTGAGSGCSSHYHLMCTSCDAIIHTDSDLLREFYSRARDELSFNIDAASSVFYGVCAKCRKARGEEDNV